MNKIVYGLVVISTVLSSILPMAAKANGGKLNQADLSSKGVSFNGAIAQKGRLVVRVHPAYRSQCTASGIIEYRFQQALHSLTQSSIQKKFTHSRRPANELNRYGKPAVDFTLVYQVSFDPSTDLQQAISTLMSSGILEYAEPLYIHQQFYNPNDPSTGNQYALTKINAYNAWNIEKGDSNVVIGIVDSGTDWDHPDLQANIAYNWNDPINGVDDDNDGYVDNFRGWDVSENDNNPMVVNSDHGSHVSGCAAAVTDNGVGVASPGFRCHFLPVKSCLDASTTSIDNGYDGVYYAAEHGCKVINCSWGRGGGPSQFEQDVVNFAVFDHDAVMVAAAGNTSSEEDDYPPAYSNVLSVAATSSTDAKAGFSTYAFSVDVCAPGNNIYSTVFDNTYVSYSGTSMAAPIAAGGVALVRSRFPSMNAQEAAQQLRVTCDNIYNTPTSNSAYRDKLGKGRINLYRAVTDSTSPGVVVDEMVSSDNNDNVFIAGDTLRFKAVFHNLLRPTANLICTLSTSSQYVTVLATPFNAGVLNSGDTVSNFSIPFRAIINAGTPLNTVVPFKITMYDGTWNDFYAFNVTVNVDYINIEINDVGTSITSKGLIGYNEAGQLQGIGFTYQGGPTILYEMGLMVGAAGTQVSDNVRGTGSTYDTDFSPVITVTGQNPGTVSDFDAYGRFSDNGTSSAAPLPVLITHRAFAWNSPAADRKYIIVEYVIKNTGSSTLNSLHAGIFADWDIPLYSNNKADEDITRSMGYCWSTDQSGLYAGIKLLTSTPFNHYAIDNVTGGGGGLDLTDGFDGTEKYSALSTSRPSAGATAATGNDVIDVVSSGPFNLSAGDSVKVAFALIAGEDLSMIQASADAAQIRYDNSFPTGIAPVDLAGVTELKGLYPNPASSAATVEFSLRNQTTATIGIYSTTGQLVKTVLDEQLSSGRYSLHIDVTSLSVGTYMLKFNASGVQQVRPLQINR
jgi:serine protease